MKMQKFASLLTAVFMMNSAVSVMPANAENTLLHSADFENGTDGWASFGGTSVATTNNEHHEGNSCLYISGRSENWQGASLSGESILTAGKTYQFNAWVQSSGSDNIQMTLKYTDSSGNDQYKGIGGADSAKGTWSEISANYEIPSDATNILIYFQTADGTNDFMIDDVSITGEANWSTELLDRTPLKDIYKNYFKIGCAATPSELNTSISQEIVKRHFNSLTLGNELKPDAVLNQAGSQAIGDNVTPAISLDNARYVLKFCEDNQISVRGHVLLWYSQTPDWFFKENFDSNGAYVSKEIMSQRLENYIKAVLNQISVEFPDLDVYCWDVVNECYLDDGSLRVAGTNPNNEESQWSLIYGDNSYIEEAFTYARKYAPEGTKLFYNDFNEYIPAKRDAIYNMAKELKDKNLIDGIGMQSHLDVGYPDTDLYRQAIDKYAELGLEIQITELDITDYNSPQGNSYKNEAAYEDIIYTILWAKKYGANITSVVFWGITDGTSWRKDGYPLLINSDYSPKPSYNKVENALMELSWVPEWTDPTTETTEPPQETSETTEPTEPSQETSETTEPTAPTQETSNSAKDIIYGDVTGDGVVSIGDVVMITRAVLGKESLSDDEYERADVDGNEKVEPADSLNVMKYVVNLINKFPIQE
ncbi:MAG: endo-1,4-beta-xylanase [Oscillospiraceae bacterium]|nr:endo-1,4-beta-xylanase [Oscillospiraceae bacterium]